METPVQALTDRQERFVFEYLKDQNASAAAERAGYAARSRASQASELMQNPAVRERVRMEMQSLLAELRLSALDLMKERMRAAFFRAGKLFDASGQLLGFEEMEAEVRDSLVISGKWRKGEPEVRFRQPNREPALRALERVHERLEKLNEQHYEKMERQGQAYAPAAAWPVMQPAQAVGEAGRADEAAAAVERGRVQPAQAVMAQAEQAAPTAIEPEVPPTVAADAPAQPQIFVEKPQVPQGDFFQGVFSGSANTTVVQAPVPATPAGDFAEISQVFSGSAEKPAESATGKRPERSPLGGPAKPSLLSKALAALSPGKKENAPPDLAPAPLPVRGNLNPGAPLVKRHDPSLMWGGPRKYVPPEPSPALLEHLARIKHEELNAEVKREMELRGGKIKPGEVRPAYPSGFNPPWLRDQRPRYAIGAGEFYFSGEEPED